MQECFPTEEDEHTEAQELVAGGELFYRTSKEQEVPANSKEFLNNLLVGLHQQQNVVRSVTKLNDELDVLYKEQKAILRDEVTSKHIGDITKRLASGLLGQYGTVKQVHLFKRQFTTSLIKKDIRDILKPPKRTLPGLIRKHLMKKKNKTLDILWLNGVKNMEEKLKKMFKYDEENPDIS